MGQKPLRLELRFSSALICFWQCIQHSWASFLCKMGPSVSGEPRARSTQWELVQVQKPAWVLLSREGPLGGSERATSPSAASSSLLPQTQVSSKCLQTAGCLPSSSPSLLPGGGEGVTGPTGTAAAWAHQVLAELGVVCWWLWVPFRVRSRKHFGLPSYGRQGCQGSPRVG